MMRIRMPAISEINGPRLSVTFIVDSFVVVLQPRLNPHQRFIGPSSHGPPNLLARLAARYPSFARRWRIDQSRRSERIEVDPFPRDPGSVGALNVAGAIRLENVDRDQTLGVFSRAHGDQHSGLARRTQL